MAAGRPWLSPGRRTATLGALDSRNVAVVKEAFRAWIEEGVEASVESLLRCSHPDCEFRPYAGHGRVLHGAEEVREFFADRPSGGATYAVRAQSFEEVGDEVVVRGSLRVGRPGGGFAETQVRWSYRFRDGLIEAATWAPRYPVPSA